MQKYSFLYNMKKIGLMSDTHSHLDEKIFEVFKEVDEIWHAGDIGSIELLDQLKAFKPTKAIYGNIDDATIRLCTSFDLFFEMEGLKIYINHYGGTPKKYDFRALEKLNDYQPDIFICGHSHILRVLRDTTRNNMLFVNPGACGVHGFHKVKTCVRFTLDAGKIKDFEVVELGARAKINL